MKGIKGATEGGGEGDGWFFFCFFFRFRMGEIIMGQAVRPLCGSS